MSHSVDSLTDSVIAECQDASRLGMSLSSIGTLIGLSPRATYDLLRIGEVSLAYSESGMSDSEIESDIGIGRAIHGRARSLYQAIALGRSLGERSALRSLDLLVSGVSESDTVPTILPSLPAIKLRLGMSVAYNDTHTMSPAIDQTRDIAINSTNRLSLSELQSRRDKAIESSRLLSSGSDSHTLPDSETVSQDSNTITEQ